VKREDREALESKITQKLLVALDGDPSASMLKTAIEFLTLTDAGRIKPAATTEEKQRETLDRLKTRLGGFPFAVPRPSEMATDPEDRPRPE
jgi:hypothetical protein